MGLRVLAHADRIAQAWKNGGGITREVATFPSGASMDEFDWRVSIADVSAPGPFSRFDGIDRILTILDGTLLLEFQSEIEPILLRPGSKHAFDGEAAVYATPIGGAVRDLNIMVRRGRWNARIEHYVSGLHGGDVRIAIAREHCAMLSPCDALLLNEHDELPPSFTGYLIRLYCGTGTSASPK